MALRYLPFINPQMYLRRVGERAGPDIKTPIMAGALQDVAVQVSAGQRAAHMGALIGQCVDLAGGFPYKQDRQTFRKYRGHPLLAQRVFFYYLHPIVRFHRFNL